MMSLVIRRGNSNKLWPVSHLNKLNKRPTTASSTSLIEQAIVLLKIMWAKKQLIGEENDHVFYLEKQLFAVPIHEISVLAYYMEFSISPKIFLTGLKEYMEQPFLPMRSSKRNVVLHNSASLNSNRGFWTQWNALPLFILTNFTFVLNWISKEAGAHISTKEIFSSNSITDITNFTEKRLALTWIPESITRPPPSSCFFEIISPRVSDCFTSYSYGCIWPYKFIYFNVIRIVIETFGDLAMQYLLCLYVNFEHYIYRPVTYKETEVGNEKRDKI